MKFFPGDKNTDKKLYECCLCILLWPCIPFVHYFACHMLINNLGGSYNYVTKPAMLTSFMLRLRVGYFSLCMKFSEYASLVFNLVLRFEMTRDFYRYHVDPVAIAVLRPL